MREELPALPALPALLRPQSLATLECQSRLLLQCDGHSPQMQVAPPLPHCAGGHRLCRWPVGCERQWAVGPQMQVAPPSDATGCCQRGPPRIVQVASGLRTPLANDASNPDLANDRQNQSSCRSSPSSFAPCNHSYLLRWFMP